MPAVALAAQLARAAVLVGSLAATPSALLAAEALLLHVPSPDWRDQIVVYFVVTDRFADGNRASPICAITGPVPGSRSAIPTR
jgi:hypothetical protein